MCRKGHGGPARILLLTLSPRLPGGKSTYLAYASYNTPPFVCVEPKLLDGGMALVWLHASSFSVVWRASFFFLMGMYGKRLYTFTVLSPSTQTGLVLFLLFFFIPLSSIMYDSSHGATQSTRAVPLLLNIKLEYIIKPRWQRAWTGGGDLGLGCWSEGKGGWGAY